MGFKKRNRLIKIFSLALTTSLVTIPLTSCFGNNHNNNINQGGGIVDNSTGSSNVVKKSYVEPEIKESISASGDIKVIDVNNDNEDKVYRSIKEFLTNAFDESKIQNKVSKEMFLKDAYSYFYKIYAENRGIFSFYFNKPTALEVTKNEEKNELKVSLSISLKIENNRYDKQVFDFEGHSIELEGYDYLILDLNIGSQQPKFIINSSNNRYFLGVSFDNVEFSLTKSEFYVPEQPSNPEQPSKPEQPDNPEQPNGTNGKNTYSNKENTNDGKIKFSENNFSFTKNTFSNLFLTEYTYVTDALDYEGALDHEQVKAYYNALTEQEIKDSIEKGVAGSQQIYKEFVTAANALVTSLGNNDNALTLIKKITPSFVKILQELNIIPKGEKVYNLFIDLLVENKPLIVVIANNNQIFTEIITSLISKDPFVVNLISSLLTKFKPNMTQDEKNKLKEEIHGLLGKFGANNLSFVNVLIDCLLNDGTLFDMLKTALTNDEIINLLKGAIGSQFSAIIDLLVELFKNNSINKPLIELFVDNKEKIIGLIGSLIGNNQTIKSILSLFLNSDGFSKENLLDIFNKTLKPLTEGILNKTTIDKKFNNFSYDKQNQKVTYDYSYEYVFNSEITIDLTPVKKLFPKKIDLKELGIDTASIDSQVDGYQVINTDKSAGYEWYIFSDNDNHKDITDILKQIPDNLTFGNNDKISFNYSNTNQKLWLNPTKDTDGKWYFGIQLPYVLKISLNAPSMFEKIKTNFGDQTLGGYGFNIWNEVGLTIVNILSKVYSTSGVLYSYDVNKILNNFDYRDDLYMKDYSFSYLNLNIDQNTFNSINSNFTLTSLSKNETVGSETFFNKINDENNLNKMLITDFENSNLNKNGYLFSYNALNSTYTGTETAKKDKVDKGVKIRIPFRVLGKVGNKKTTLDLVIFLNISNFSNNVYLPFKVKTSSGWSNSFSLTKTNLVIDAVADVRVPIFNSTLNYGKVKLSLANILI